MESKHLHIGMKAPDFTANSTNGPLKLSDYNGKWVILFSHPGDFTPVCTTEFVAFSQAEKEFSAKNTQLIGLSVDSNPSHLAWVYAIYMTTGITVPFPVIADRMGDVAKLYGMIAPDVSNTETVRNVFFIDPQQIIRAILVYPLTNGRSVPEILRLLTALQATDRQKAVTPANWQPGQPAMVAAPQTYGQLMTREQDPQELGLECKDWFWCYSPQLPEAPKPAVLPAESLVQPANPDNVPAKPDNVPVKPEGVPVKPESVPAKLDNVPAKAESMPAKPYNVPAKADSMPVKPYSMPAKAESMPAKPDSIPTKPQSWRIP